MCKQSIMSDVLKSFDYYVEKLPMFLQESYGFIEHFRIWHDVLNATISASDETLCLLNIFDSDYLDKIRDLPDSGSTGPTNYGTKSDILDKLGKFFGVNRTFSCTYEDTSGTRTDQLTLNNEDFLLLIKGQIIKNYCEGTYEQLVQYYQNAGLRVFIITSSENATSALHLVELDEGDYSDNVKKMFKAGLLRIASVGIKYNDYLVKLTGFLTWDGELGGDVWDVGVWGE